MLTLFVLVPLVAAVIVIAKVVRLVVRPFGRPRFGRRFGRPGLLGRRRHGLGGGLLSILALVALDRLFTHRRF